MAGEVEEVEEEVEEVEELRAQDGKGARKQMMNDWSGPWVTLSPPMGKR